MLDRTVLTHLTHKDDQSYAGGHASDQGERRREEGGREGGRWKQLSVRATCGKYPSLAGERFQHKVCLVSETFFLVSVTFVWFRCLFSFYFVAVLKSCLKYYRENEADLIRKISRTVKVRFSQKLFVLPECQGCEWSHLSYTGQKKISRSLVLTSLCKTFNW